MADVSKVDVAIKDLSQEVPGGAGKKPLGLGFLGGGWGGWVGWLVGVWYFKE